MKLSWLILCSGSLVMGQSPLQQKEEELKALKQKEQEINAEIERLKLAQCLNLLQLPGYPVSTQPLQILEHSAYAMGFDCNYKMPAWTFHIVIPDITFGNVSRSNDFRIDSTASCGSSEERDYFIRKQKSDGTFSYEGFGFDRGHLIPSADFKWSPIGLSETYYYSNMSPQRPQFNRESWAEVEGLVRNMVEAEKKNLYVLTAPILSGALKTVERSVHQLKIPDWHYKIVADLSVETPRGMAFLMPNQKCEFRPSHYVVSIDSLEKITGLDFFPKLNDSLEQKIESSANFSVWQTQSNYNDVEPLNALELPKGYFNTEQALSKVGATCTIVGKVVSAKFSAKSEATFLNLDQSFPRQIFSVIIWKDGRRNFSFKPETDLMGKYIAVKGKVDLDKNGIPGITVKREEQIQVLEDDFSGD
jgi:endonuclease G